MGGQSTDGTEGEEGGEDEEPEWARATEVALESPPLPTVVDLADAEAVRGRRIRVQKRRQPPIQRRSG